MLKKIFMALVTVSALANAYERTYTDPKTGLMWQDDRDTVKKKMTWHQGRTYCAALRLGGYKDWRLPSVQELYTLIDLSKEDPAAVDELRFVGPKDYWTATQVAGDSDDAWLVYFEDGVVNHYSKTRERRVRCVRNVGAKQP